MTSKSKIQFDKNIDSINIIDGIYTYFEIQVPALDLSEIIRAQYVLLVSAFDYYIHDLVREGMIKIFDGVNNSNNNYDNFSISLKTLNLILSTEDKILRTQLLDNQIREVTSKHTYQAPSNVERALALIDVRTIWTSVGVALSMSPEDVKKELALIVDRRNKIAHESDIHPLTNDKTPIDRSTFIYVKSFVANLVAAIDGKI